MPRKTFAALAMLVLVVVSVVPVPAQDPKVTIAMSGWTGFAPLSLAEKAGLFKKHGVDATIKFIPQKDRHLAIASGDVACAATTVETWIVWNANGVATRQVVQLDKSYGADGMVVRKEIGKIADLRGKTVAASAPGTAPYFTLAWFLKKNGLTVKDVKVVNLEPGPAAQAFIAGQNDAAMTYEPYLSSVREKPEAGRIIASPSPYTHESLALLRNLSGADQNFIAVGTDLSKRSQRRGPSVHPIAVSAPDSLPRSGLRDRHVCASRSSRSHPACATGHS